jgi:hypothetical protein
MKNQAETVSSILKEWESIKVQLEQLFRNRDQKDTKKWMEKGIDLFIQFLYCTNDETYTTTNNIPYSKFHLKPVNIDERLVFIMSRPALYHSYRQLSELMVEQEKQYAKSTIAKKSSRLQA